MRVYLAATKCVWNLPNFEEDWNQLYLLSTFFEFWKSKKLHPYVYSKRHISDSGAFSTFTNPQLGKNINWDDYTKRYAAFVKENGNELYFELDIDGIVGLPKVEDYRKLLEDTTGRPPIPVWHVNRGWDYFEMMCENYPYVAIGTTIANKTGQGIRKNPMILKKFIDTAHKKGVKIHGLGFTDTKLLDKLHFDSVDSTSWTIARFGGICKFDGKYMTSVSKPDGMKMKYSTSYWHRHNILEWVKYQKYMLNVNHDWK